MLLILLIKVRVNFTELILPSRNIPVIAFVGFGDAAVLGVITDVFVAEIVTDDNTGMVPFSISEIRELY